MLVHQRVNHFFLVILYTVESIHLFQAMILNHRCPPKKWWSPRSWTSLTSPSAPVPLILGEALADSWGYLGDIPGLVNFHIAMERSTIFNGKIHYKWPFSIAMLNYQRVSFISLTRGGFMFLKELSRLPDEFKWPIPHSQAYLGEFPVTNEFSGFFHDQQPLCSQECENFKRFGYTVGCENWVEGRAVPNVWGTCRAGHQKACRSWWFLILIPLIEHVYHRYYPLKLTLPSGKLRVCYGKWPSRNSGFTHWNMVDLSIVFSMFSRPGISSAGCLLSPGRQRRQFSSSEVAAWPFPRWRGLDGNIWEPLSMGDLQEPIDWRYRFHICLAYFSGLFCGNIPRKYGLKNGTVPLF